MAQYLLLIYEDETKWATASAEFAEQFDKEHFAFAEANAAALCGGNALLPSSMATSLRRDQNGGVNVTHGGFARTGETIGGYYLIEAADVDEATAVARQVPTRWGGVEVRPVRAIE